MGEMAKYHTGHQQGEECGAQMIDETEANTVLENYTMGVLSWINKQQQSFLVQDMDDKYVKNVLEYLKNKNSLAFVFKPSVKFSWIKVLECEIIKRNSKNHHQINKYLKSIGFEHLTAGNGCHEYIKDIGNGKSLQINAEGLGKLTSIDDEQVHIGIFTSSDCTLPWDYQQSYPNLVELLNNEKERIGWTRCIR